MTRAALEDLAYELALALRSFGMSAQPSRSTLQAISIFGATAETYPEIAKVLRNRAVLGPLGATGIVILSTRTSR